MKFKRRICAPLLAAAVTAGALGAAQAASADAVKLLNQHCQQCHEVKGIGDFGNVGPSLVDIKSRYPDKDVAAIIYDETKRNELTAMPPFGRNLILDQQEIETIVDYLYKQ